MLKRIILFSKPNRVQTTGTLHRNTKENNANINWLQYDDKLNTLEQTIKQVASYYYPAGSKYKLELLLKWPLHLISLQSDCIHFEPEDPANRLD